MSRRNQRTKTLCRRGNPTYKDERQIRGLFRGYRPDAVTANEREADRLVVPFVKVRPPVLHEPAQLFLRPPVTKRLVFDRALVMERLWVVDLHGGQVAGRLGVSGAGGKRVDGRRATMPAA